MRKHQKLTLIRHQVGPFPINLLIRLDLGLLRLCGEEVVLYVLLIGVEVSNIYIVRMNANGICPLGWDGFTPFPYLNPYAVSHSGGPDIIST